MSETLVAVYLSGAIGMVCWIAYMIRTDQYDLLHRLQKNVPHATRGQMTAGIVGFALFSAILWPILVIGATAKWVKNK